MTTPNILFGTLAASLLGAIFHLWLGGGPGRLFLYLVLSWVGFWSGHALGELLQVTFLNIGPLHLGAAILSNIVFLVAGHWLSKINISSSSDER